ncbi:MULTISPECIES: lipoprotein [unclassified Limnohabitans]|uniref:LPS translocon maturation chaperone LptM n=1 Tax=unclassified Limnohabitans TaxID=2626134 RepID=UPI000C1F3F00|nr:MULTISPECIES: lipoprotein [unclassified Limnohabitans]
MGIEQKILVRASALGGRVAVYASAVVLMAACGQKGPLQLPNDPEFQQRATLPDIVRRQLPGGNATPNAPSPIPAASAPVSPASSGR